RWRCRLGKPNSALALDTASAPAERPVRGTESSPGKVEYRTPWLPHPSVLACVGDGHENQRVRFLRALAHPVDSPTKVRTGGIRDVQDCRVPQDHSSTLQFHASQARCRGASLGSNRPQTPDFPQGVVAPFCEHDCKSRAECAYTEIPRTRPPSFISSKPKDFYKGD